MMKSLALGISGALLVVCSLSSNARAQNEDLTKSNWPLAVVERPILIPTGMLELRGDTVRINMSDDSLGGVGDPIALAPDIYYGFSRTFNVGIVHRDTGICISGDLCDKAYNDIGIDALFGFMNEGSFLAALRGGVRVPSFDNFVAGLNLGLDIQIKAGKLMLDFDPKIYVGAIGREPDAMGDAAMKEELDLPLLIWYQAQKQTALFLRTGLQGELKDFGDGYKAPIGVGASFAANNRLDFGAEFVFGNLAGKVPDGTERTDERYLIGRIALRL